MVSSLLGPFSIEERHATTRATRTPSTNSKWATCDRFIKLSQVTHFWLVDGVLVVVVACRSSMENRPWRQAPLSPPRYSYGRHAQGYLATFSLANWFMKKYFSFFQQDRLILITTFIYCIVIIISTTNTFWNLYYVYMWHILQWLNIYNIFTMT